MENLKAQMWQKWFVEPIPMLGNQSPIDASQTAEGRQKLEQLWAYHEKMNSMATPNMAGSFDFNVPAKYARWKLGFGPGSASEFQAEDKILTMNGFVFDDKKTTNRTESHQKKLSKKQGAIFVPKRCEVQGCDVLLERYLKCGSCQLVFYCSKEHQKEDWKRHKVECKHLKESGLKRKYFQTETELEKYPLGCFPLERQSSSDKNLRCFICGSGKKEVDIGFTECCNAPVCDNAHEYEIMSYSRDFCMRSHNRYTLCGFHHTEGHDGDWRDCTECKSSFDSKQARSWYSTNGFNLTPGLEQDYEKGSFITYPCSKCKARIIPGHDPECFGPSGAICQSCSGRF